MHPAVPSAPRYSSRTPTVAGSVGRSAPARAYVSTSTVWTMTPRPSTAILLGALGPYPHLMRFGWWRTASLKRTTAVSLTMSRCADLVSECSRNTDILVRTPGNHLRSSSRRIIALVGTSKTQSGFLSTPALGVVPAARPAQPTRSASSQRTRHTPMLADASGVTRASDEGSGLSGPGSRFQARDSRHETRAMRL